jgi:hypothetical protein
MKTRCKNGNTVERFYDRQTRSSVTRVLDPNGNQIGEADYSGNKKSADFAKAMMLKDNEGIL